MDLKRSPTCFSLPLLVAASLATGARAAPPSPVAARLAVAAFERGTARYQGTIDGPDLSGHLLVSLDERPSGELAGEALLLTPDHRLLAAAPVSGLAHGTACSVSFAFDPRPTTLDGICSPALLGGTLTTEPRRTDLLTRLIFWWDDRAIPGEAWLASGGDLPEEGGHGP